jgi:hypothetical protein
VFKGEAFILCGFEKFSAPLEHGIMPKYLITWSVLEALLETWPCKHILANMAQTTVVPCNKIRHSEPSQQSPLCP